MGEANRMRENGIQFKQLQPGQQIQIDLKNAVPKVCQAQKNFGASEICGCDLFIPAVKVFTVSAIVSPTGQEMMAQQPVLVCMACNTAL